MTSTGWSRLFLGVVAAGVGATSLWGQLLHPGPRWLGLACLLPALWGFVEVAQHRGADPRAGHEIMTWHRAVLGITGLLLASGLAFRLAMSAGLLDLAWNPVLQRTRGMLMGACLTVWGNYLPRLLSPWNKQDEPFDWQRVHRFAGSVMFIAGLVVVAAWMVLPVEGARVLVGRALPGAFALVLARKFLSVVATARSTPRIEERHG